MRPRPFLLLLAGVALALMAAGEADAGKEPEWSYDTGNDVHSVAISADGQYTASGSDDNKVYLVNGDGDIWS
ncbi:MAG: WD40 repeat domain-containing protein, partial [Candidatus Poseidoniia archaeon]|nr:WD40 repeat domain-containing protein [Candidatus Poseidoniia archaeon]